jgi:hypothetical protein
MNDFQIVLTRMLRLTGKSVQEVAYLGGIDPAYLRRLLSGEKHNPSPETVLKIWIGLIACSGLMKEHPVMIHGLAELSEAAAITAGSLSLTGA